MYGWPRVRQLLETRETRSPGSQGPGQAGRQAGGRTGAGCEAGRQVGIRQEGSQGTGQAGWHEGREKGRKGWKRDKIKFQKIDLSTFACICSSSICIKDGKST
jgi:hypothetical protein